MKRAPVQGTWGRGGWVIPPGTIAWDEHVTAWVAYRERYGASQSAERIAERGGFGMEELRMFLGRDPTTFEHFKKVSP